MMKKIMIGTLLTIALAGMLIFNINKVKGNDEGTATFSGKEVSVEAMRVGNGEIASTVVLSGSVKELEKNEVVTDGMIIIDEVFVSSGDEVKIGDKLFDIDLSDLNMQLEKAQINYDIQSLQLQKLKNSSNNKDSSKISVEISRLNVESAQRTYDTKVETFEKKKQLFEEGIISQEEYNNLETAVVEAESALTSAKLSLERSQSELSSSSATSSIDIEVQVKNLESLALNIEELEKKIADVEALTLAPSSGTITSLNVMKGDHKQAMSNLLTIIDMSKMKVEAQVREYDIKKIHLEDSVSITGDAINDENIVGGKVDFIAPIAEVSIVNNRQTTTVDIDIQITDGIEFLKPGYKTDCEVKTELKTEAILADYNMFKEDEEGNTTVFLIHDDGRIEQVIVELGITSDFKAEITSGLSTGDLVVLNPSLIVKDGMKAKISNEDAILTVGE